MSKTIEESFPLRKRKSRQILSLLSKVIRSRIIRNGFMTRTHKATAIVVKVVSEKCLLVNIPSVKGNGSTRSALMKK